MQKDILSPQEIEALVKGDEIAHDPSVQGKRVAPYDFRSPELLSKEKLRIFQILMEEFSKKILEFLTTQLKIAVEINIASIHQAVYKEFQEREEDTRMAVFTMDPVEGSSLLEIKTPFIKFINQALLGHVAEALPEASALTPVEEETGVFLANKFLYALKTAFAKLIDLTPNIMSIEKNPQLVFIASPEEPVIITTIRFFKGETSCDVYFCFPYIVFDSLLPYLDFKKWFFITQRKKDSEIDRLLQDNIEKIELDIVCELGIADVRLKDVLALEEGDYLKLSRPRAMPLDLKIGEAVKFKVAPGMKGRKLALKIEKVLKNF